MKVSGLFICGMAKAVIDEQLTLADLLCQVGRRAPPDDPITRAADDQCGSCDLPQLCAGVMMDAGICLDEEPLKIFWLSHTAQKRVQGSVSL